MRPFFIILFAVLLGFPMRGYASDNDIKELKQRVQALEKQNQQLDDGNNKPPAPASSSTTATGVSRAFNPAISVNGLFLGAYRSVENDNPNADPKTGLSIQEMEVQFTANVDTYLKANMLLSMESTNSIEIEESYVDALIASNLSLRAGKFLAAFGKHNLLHAHQFPFIDKPLANEAILGEGLNEVGASLNLLAPFPWYSELNLQLLEGENQRLLNGALNDDFAYLGHFKNLWDLNEDATLELGGSYLTGKNSVGGHNSNSQAAGGNLTIKWKPSIRPAYKTLIWQTEYLTSWRQTGIDSITEEKNPDAKIGGISSFIQYRFDRNWWAQGRYDYLGFPNSTANNDSRRLSALLGYVPSEFSAIRLQYNHLNETARDEHQLFLQLNFTMGSHPAHQY